MTDHPIPTIVKLHAFVSKKFPEESIEMDARKIGYWAKRAGLHCPEVPKEPAKFQPKGILTLGRWTKDFYAHKQLAEAAIGWREAHSENRT